MKIYKLVDSVDLAYVPGHGKIKKGDEIRGDYDAFIPYPLQAMTEVLTEPAPSPVDTVSSTATVEAEGESEKMLLTEVPEDPVKADSADAPKVSKKKTKKKTKKASKKTRG